MTTTALAKPATTAVATNTEDDPFLAYGKAGGGTIVGELLKFAKGDYLAGQDSREIPIGTRLVANMDSLETGWVCWQDGRPAEYRMGLVVEHFTPAWRKDLGDLDKNLWVRDEKGEPRDPWQRTENIQFADPSDGKIYTFSTSSVGGRNALRDLCTDYANKRRQHPNEHPVIELGVDSYQHSNKQLGRIKTPTFVIVGWHAKDSVNLQPSQAAAHLTTETPSPQRRIAPPREEAPPWEHPGDPGYDPANLIQMNDDIPW
jgi:hypothetical protein